ncbi:MAG TPA: glycosyltransferase family A protein [Thermoleophilaceae bacterium]|nr:glycosyltransferase family A protein [Thermoleophilaceae bacterium]
METPRVSVLIGTWNDADVVPRAIRSVLEQTLGDLELLVLDDGSDDGTEQVVEQQFDDARLRYLKLPHRGIAATLNEGLGEARSDLVAILDADDWCLPTRLERQVALLEARPDVAVVGCRMQEVDEHGDELRARTSFRAGEVNGALRWFNPIPNTAAALRRSAALEAGAYDGRWLYAMDYDLWLRLAERHKVWTLDEVLAVRSMRGTNFGASNERPMMREVLSIQLAAMRRQPSAAGVGGMAIPTLSLATPTSVKRAARRVLGQAP